MKVRAFMCLARCLNSTSMPFSDAESPTVSKRVIFTSNPNGDPSKLSSFIQCNIELSF